MELNQIKVENNKWEDFFENCKNKKIILFGISEFTELFWERDKKGRPIYAVIDNDVKKQNCFLGDLCVTPGGKVEKIVIHSVEEVCKHINVQETVVLICNQRYHMDMARQLEEYGIYNYYKAHLMEAKWEKENGVVIDRSLKKKEYLNKCIKEQKLVNKCLVFVEKYGGHGIYISRSLHNLMPDFQIVWVVSDLHIPADDYVKKVSATNWKKVINEIETANIVIYDNKVLSTVYKKREGQVFIQTKHWSSVTLKKFWLDDPSSLYPEQLEKIRELEMNTDYCFVGSEFDKKTCESGFGFKGDYIKVGSCRSDILFDNGKIQELKNKYGLNLNKRYILYAPTSRREGENGINRLKVNSDMPDFESLLHNVKERFGGEWELIIRLHPGLSYLAGRFCDMEYIHDFTSVQDGQEIVAITDIMLTDYSSIMFEPAFVNKPVFLYAPDKEEFLEKERGFWINYNELPFPIAETEAELRDNILNFENEVYLQKKDKFMEFYGVNEDGHASERAAEFIFKLIKTSETQIE